MVQEHLGSLVLGQKMASEIDVQEIIDEFIFFFFFYVPIKKRLKRFSTFNKKKKT